MPLAVRGLRLELDEPEELLRERAARRLKVSPEAIRCYAPVRRSLDARDRDDIHLVYNVELSLGDRSAERRAAALRHRDDVQMLHDDSPPDPQPGTEPMGHRPVVVGFGPAGMFAAMMLAERGYRPIVLERGRDVTRRHYDVIKRFWGQRDFDPESNLLFGEGGAGAYSDGKLYTRRHDPRALAVLQTFYRFGADPSVVLDGHPHVGSDRLPNICRRMRLYIESLGGQVRFDQRVQELWLSGGRVAGLRVNHAFIAADVVVLAIGHSARDLLRALARQGVAMAAKPFQLGVRVEHPQALVNRWRYGAMCESARLPPADYQLVARGAAGRAGDVFSFCMCPGGTILPTNESPGLIATNGASKAARDGPLANSGLVVTVDPASFGDDPFAGLALQESLERKAYAMTGGSYRVPAQRASDLLAGRASDGELTVSYPLGGQWTDLRQLLPADLQEAVGNALRHLDRRLPGFAGPQTMVTAPETRASSPVRIVRHPQTCESVSVRNLYPVGEGAGYAGGILSAAIDSLKTAERIVSRFAPPR